MNTSMIEARYEAIFPFDILMTETVAEAIVLFKNSKDIG